jgi:hypothetical protein
MENDLHSGKSGDLINVDVDGADGWRRGGVTSVDVNVDVNGAAHVHVRVVETWTHAVVAVATVGKR